MTIWVSHRGESYDAPENTMAAFQLALERDTDAWETDIHFSSDKVVICCHDPNTLRTCGVDKEIAQTTFKELQTLDASNGKAGYEGEKIPAFSEVLALLPQGKLLFTEIKVDDPELVDAMMREIDNSGVAREQIIVISFYPEMIKVCKERYPEMKALFLCSMSRSDGTLVYQPQELLDKLAYMHADGLDARGDKNYLTEEFVKKLTGSGYSLALWTIDQVETAEYFINAVKPEAITSNRAAYLQGVIDHGKER